MHQCSLKSLAAFISSGQQLCTFLNIKQHPETARLRFSSLHLSRLYSSVSYSASKNS